MLYLTTAAALSMTAGPHGRHLSYANILMYQPGSQVTDHANIDLDQAALMSALGSLPSGFTTAKDIYTTGAYSKPTAVCTLETGIAAAVAKKDSISFTTNNGLPSVGKAYSSYEAGATEVSFTYPVSEMQVEPLISQCYQGGLLAGDQSTLGCIAAPGEAASGDLHGGMSKVTIDGTDYQATCTNRGKRTLQGFSTKAQSVMYDCPVDTDVSYANGCPYTSYKPYYDYYGDFSYADTIVSAALDATAITSFTNGNLDFTGVADVARVEHIKKGTAYMSTWMYTIREFEDAIDDCLLGDLTANALSSGPVHAWDEGVAFYTGSLLTMDDMLTGNLASLDKKGKQPYTLANKRCKNYHTCGPDGTVAVGEAYANIALSDLFQQGQRQLLVGACDKVVPIKNAIVPKMTIPLIQGTLRYAFKVAALSGADKEKAEGSIFAMAVLPQVHACDPEAAATIFTNMNINGDTCDYMAVKAAFESCYGAMGISCTEIGGLWDSGTDGYYIEGDADASPCVDPEVTAAAAAASSNETIAIAVGAAVAAILLLCLLYLVCKERAGKPVFNTIS